MMDVEEIKARILHKLARKKVWGGKHTSFDNITKGFPAHLIGDAKHAGESLIKEGFLMPKQTLDGLHVSLNPRLNNDIVAIIERYVRKEF